MENIGTTDLSHFTNYKLDSSGCSIGLPADASATSEKTATFACKVEWKGLGAIANLYLYAQVAYGSYVPIQVAEGKQVYVKAQLVDGLKAVEALKSIDSTMKTVSVSDIASSLKRVCDFLEEHPICDVISSSDASIMKKDGKWKKADVHGGGTTTAYVCDKVAMKLYRGNIKEEPFSKVKADARSEQGKQAAIAKIINPTGAPDIKGLLLPKIALLGERKIISFNLNINTFTESKGIAHEEDAFLSDLSHAKIPQEEISSVCACLVQGSKTLLNNKIYHLDAKPQNMAYLGNGQAKHFDFAQSVNCNNPNWQTEEIVHTPKYVPREYADVKEGTEAERLVKMTRVHIYELGMAFLSLAVNFEGEGLLEGKKSGDIETMISTVRMSTGGESVNPISDEDIKQLLKIYTTRQASCVINMTGGNEKFRPNMTQIENFFPASFIMK